MVITRTPLRISFVGGGTDFGDFYRTEAGAVLSTTIDKYLYVIVKERFDRKIYLSYTKKEIADHVDELQHDLVREAMKRTGVAAGVEIAMLADIPSEGSGLGSSSALLVGLLNALYQYRGVQVPAGRLAREACEIEIDILGRPIGKQDQYIAAYGGLRRFDFRADNSVDVTELPLTENDRSLFAQELLLFFTGRTRKSATILAEQKENILTRWPLLRAMRDQVPEAVQAVREADWNYLGCLMHEGWRMKRELASGVSDPELDRLYDRALRAGASGGKIAGAGGGGFLLLHCPLGYQPHVRAALKELDEFHFGLEPQGSRAIFNTR
jgi:D-glycero-alpha-D-manno-heptose-7-phosphate kinase